MTKLEPSSLPKDTNSIRYKIVNFWRSTYNWFTNTPERAIAQAYKAAETIREIENEHFNGNKIAPESISPELPNYSSSIIIYWQASLNTNLKIIKIRLAEYRLSFPLINTSNQELLEKLKFIDDVTAKYLPEDEITVSDTSTNITITAQIVPEITRNQAIKTNSDFQPARPNSMSKKTGILPRSIGRTINRIRSDFSPQAEEQFVEKFRTSKKRTQASIKFILMLILIPLLTHQLAKQLLITPVVERVRGENTPHIFMNTEMEDEALEELKIYEGELKFESLILKAPTLSPEKIEEKVKEKAIEIYEVFRAKSTNAISNVFADIFSLIAFAIVVVTSKREIEILKSFMDEVVYGLSDSAKAFLIILFTDIFVGFHSPHGWEVILEGVAEHLGLPPNRSAISLFIATFPVVLDTISKYWIFRYLSRLSPSALATLKEMNE
ncbi:proton extrusion protein PcxA [Brunnivagina elsteri]|uniref:Proton extrusion protein PxcA n=1 Tax=Brunnivagina elsteri CCALA 953 TaxID=987040 RepID=A0A2A2TAG5_9CYAN|nr:proton extrusion protein PcxA [Calothrix elsteri]PAX47328.1 proton extrusion protein PcxA [Calothrix elsteri CCALA 953]